MSVAMLSAIRNLETGLARRKSVLYALADMADDNGVAWPSVSTIAQITELSKRSVERSIRELREAGLVVIEKRSRGEHKFFNRYHLNTSTIDRLTKPNRQGVVPVRQGGGGYRQGVAK